MVLIRVYVLISFLEVITKDEFGILTNERFALFKLFQVVLTDTKF